MFIFSSAGGGFQRPTTSGGQRPSTASRPMSRRGSGVASNGIRPFSRQGSAMANGGRQIGMKKPGCKETFSCPRNDILGHYFGTKICYDTGVPLLTLFLRLWKNNRVSRKPCKKRSDLVQNGKMRVSTKINRVI